MKHFWFALPVLLASRLAWADGPDPLTIVVAGYGSWPSTVAALQSDTHAEGRVVRVSVVRSDGTPPRCGQYTITLDDVGNAAFTLGVCDPTDGATPVTLAHRDALFAHDDVVPRPLSAGISAVEVLTGGAAGGAGTAGGSELLCSVSVRPYLTDLEHGTRVYLPPGRFQLRPVSSAIRVDVDATGWTLRGGRSGALTIEYDVVDTQRAGAVVVHDQATLACATQAVPDANGAIATPEGPKVPTPNRVDAPALAPGVPYVTGPANPRATVMVGFNVLGVALADVSHLQFSNGTQTVTGAFLGLGPQTMYETDVSLAFFCQGFYAAATADAMLSDVTSAVDARVTLAGAFQHGNGVFFAGPTARVSAYASNVGSASYGTGIVPAVDFEAGLRVKTSTWLPARGRFSVTGFQLDFIVPAWGGSWLAAIGGSWGAGI